MSWKEPVAESRRNRLADSRDSPATSSGSGCPQSSATLRVDSPAPVDTATSSRFGEKPTYWPGSHRKPCLDTGGTTFSALQPLGPRRERLPLRESDSALGWYPPNSAALPSCAIETPLSTSGKENGSSK